MKKYHLKAGLAAAALSLAGTSLSAQAQAPAAAFTADEAAYCTATFGWLLENMNPETMPQEAVFQTNLAFMMWGYELNAAVPNATEADMKNYAGAAISRLNSNMPAAIEGEEGAKQTVAFIMTEATSCGQKLEAQYPNGQHPVIIAMRAQAQQQAAEAAAASE